MKNPYQKRLEEYVDTDKKLVINRANAADVNGTVAEIDDDGCTIKQPGSSDSALYVFIAYEDIRGVGVVDWDLD